MAAISLSQRWSKLCSSALTLLVGGQEEHPAQKISEDSGVVIFLQRGANDLHMVQLMPLPPDHLCFSKIQNGLSLWYPFTQVVLERGH